MLMVEVSVFWQIICMIHIENIEGACLESSKKFWKLSNIYSNNWTLHFAINDFFSQSDLSSGYFSKILVSSILFMVTFKKLHDKKKLHHKKCKKVSNIATIDFWI